MGVNPEWGSLELPGCYLSQQGDDIAMRRQHLRIRTSRQNDRIWIDSTIDDMQNLRKNSCL